MDTTEAIHGRRLIGDCEARDVPQAAFALGYPADTPVGLPRSAPDAIWVA